MASLVLELQQEALDPTIALPDLLRKALVVARKLGIQDFQTWAENELNGYEDSRLVPGYRRIRGTAQYYNIVHGWQPIMFGDRESEDYWSLWLCLQSISEIGALADQKSGSSILEVSYSAEGAQALCKGIGASRSVSLTVLDSVRTIVLNWALKLEEDGILGEDITFTAVEKKAAQSRTYNITNFYAPVHSSQIQQQTSGSIQVTAQTEFDAAAIRELVEEIKTSLHELGLSRETEGELNGELGTLEAQIGSPRPKMSILRESLASVRRILEGASGAIAAQLIMRLNAIG
jgi:hypothetical protein